MYNVNIEKTLNSVFVCVFELNEILNLYWSFRSDIKICDILFVRLENPKLNNVLHLESILVNNFDYEFFYSPKICCPFLDNFWDIKNNPNLAHYSWIVIIVNRWILLNFIDVCFFFIYLLVLLFFFFDKTMHHILTKRYFFDFQHFEYYNPYNIVLMNKK